MNIRRVTPTPDQITGFPLEEGKGWFSVLAPLAVTSLNTNPSFELNLTGLTATNSTLLRVATKQRRGVYSCQITPSSTAAAGGYLTVSTTTGGQYSAGIDIYDDSGRIFDLYFASTTPSRVSRIASVRGANYWKRLWVNFAEYSGSTRRIYIMRRSGGNTKPFFIDGFLALPTEKRVAYFDGDSVGYLPDQKPAPFAWMGAPQASTSYELADTGRGGCEMNLLELGFRLIAAVGLGLMSFAPIATPLSSGGSVYQRSVAVDRSFALIGTIMGDTLPEIERSRQALIQAFSPNRTASQQPLTLLYHRVDPATSEETDVVRIPAVYSGGLEGSIDNFNQARVEITFNQFLYLPAIYSDGSQGAELTLQDTVANFNDIGYRDPYGAWHPMGTGDSGLAGDRVYCLAGGQDGTYIYAGGSFDAMGGVANTENIARWNVTSKAWSALGSGSAAGNSVRAMAVGPDGKVYAVGDFSQMGGVAGTTRVAVWDPVTETWAALGTGADNTVRGVAVGPDGKVYITGDFLNLGAVAAARAAVWDPTTSTWAALGTGLDNSGWAVIAGPDDKLYFGGDFTSADGVSASRITTYDPSTGTFTALGLGMDSTVTSLAFTAAGTLVAAGNFTTAGTKAALHVARWNGVAWLPMGAGVPTTVWGMGIGLNREIYVGDAQTPKVYQGGTWLPLDLRVSDVSMRLFAVHQALDGTLFIGGGWAAGSATYGGAVTTITAPSTMGPTYPVIEFTGPGELRQLHNFTNGKAIYFDSLTLLAGETAKLNTDPLHYSFVSNFRGDISRYVNQASTDFFLVGGENKINLFIPSNTTTAASKATMTWTPNYEALDGATH